LRDAFTLVDELRARELNIAAWTAR